MLIFDSPAQAKTTKCLILQVYVQLLTKFLSKFPTSYKRRWEEDLDMLTDDLWEEVLQNDQLVLLSPTHRVTQFFILHRVYCTLEFLHITHIVPDVHTPQGYFAVKQGRGKPL